MDKETKKGPENVSRRVAVGLILGGAAAAFIPDKVKAQSSAERIPFPRVQLSELRNTLRAEARTASPEAHAAFVGNDEGFLVRDPRRPDPAFRSTSFSQVRMDDAGIAADVSHLPDAPLRILHTHNDWILERNATQTFASLTLPVPSSIPHDVLDIHGAPSLGDVMVAVSNLIGYLAKNDLSYAASYEAVTSRGVWKYQTLGEDNDVARRRREAVQHILKQLLGELAHREADLKTLFSGETTPDMAPWMRHIRSEGDAARVAAHILIAGSPHPHTLVFSRARRMLSSEMQTTLTQFWETHQIRPGLVYNRAINAAHQAVAHGGTSFDDAQRGISVSARTQLGVEITYQAF